MLPKKERLRKTRDIKQALNARQYFYRSALLHFCARDNNLENSRLTVVVTKNLGAAVKRNRIRRQFIEAYKKIKPKIAQSIDMVLFPHNAAVDKKQDEISASLLKGLNKCGL